MRRMAVVVDYQNVHLTAAGVIAPYRPAEESLISPWNFARRLARSGHYDVVVLASRDSDLAPTLDEAMTYRRARVEAAKWYLEGSKSTYGSIKTEKRIWTTSMTEKDFQASLDTRQY